MDYMNYISKYGPITKYKHFKIPILVTCLSAVFLYTYMRQKATKRDTNTKGIWETLRSAIVYVCNCVGGHNTELEQNKKQLLDRDDEIQQLQQKQGQLLRQLEDCIQRLAAEMGKKVAANESSVENVGVKNRPMNISDDFSQLCSNEWYDVKEMCDEKCEDVGEADKLKLLYTIMMLAEDEVNTQVDLLNDRNKQMLTTPFKGLTGDPEKSDENDTEKKCIELPLEITNAIGDYMRNSADTVEMKPLKQVFLTKLDGKTTTFFPTHVWPTVKDERTMEIYINMVLRLVWKMALQRPKMKFESCNEWKGEDYQDLYWGSTDPKGKDISCFSVTPVYPMLYHGNQLMNKGKILLQNK